MRIAINGVLRDAKEAVISVYDHGFLYGMGLFETFRTYGGVPFLLEEHLSRLGEACEELGIVYKPDAANVRRTVEQLLQVNALCDAYFRFSISAGEEALGLPAGEYARPNEIMYVKPLPPRDEKLYMHGKALQLLELRRNTPEGAVRTKSFHYMNPILGRRELARYPWAAGAEGLFLDGRGCVAEGLVSNVFLVKKGRLFTPDLTTGILPGIIRGWVLAQAKVLGIEYEEGCYGVQELMSADECFLTNSIQEVVPVCAVYDPNGQRWPFGSGAPGPVTARLMGRFAQCVKEMGGAMA